MNESEQPILFYSHHGPYGCFSNFSDHRVFIQGVYWPTTEHYFQAQKFPNTPHVEEIRRASSPSQAKKLGSRRDFNLRPDWEIVKDEVMLEAVLAKFTQHRALREVLLSTGNARLVEHTERDSYWGDGGDGSGRNQLGITLMKVRDIIRQELEQEKEQSNSRPSNVENDSKSTQKNDKVEPKPPRKGTARRKREIFKDEAGDSILEKDKNNSGRVSVVGEGTSFSIKALNMHAKNVVHSNQFRRKHRPSDSDIEAMDNEEDDGYTSRPRPRLSLGDFMNTSKVSKENSREEMPSYLESPTACAASVQSVLELCKSLPNGDHSLPSLVDQLKSMKEVLAEFITAEQKEEVMAELVSKFDEVSTFLDTYQSLHR